MCVLSVVANRCGPRPADYEIVTRGASQNLGCIEGAISDYSLHPGQVFPDKSAYRHWLTCPMFADMLLIIPLVITHGVTLPGILASLSWCLKIVDLLNSVLWACNAILRAGF